MAAGIGALLLSVNPRLTWEEARDIMRSTAEKIDRAGGNYRNGFSRQYGYGRVDAKAAVREAMAVRGGRSGKAAGKKAAKKKKKAPAARKK